MATWRELAAGAEGEGIAPHEVAFLVAECSGLGRRRLLADPAAAAPPEAARRFEAAVRRRATGVPLQHVLGHWSFRRLELLTDRRALVPRPETELLVEHVLACCRRLRERRAAAAPLRVADLGTGSGAIALSLVAEDAQLSVLALDASRDALALAAANRARLGGDAARRCRLVASDWWAAVSPRARFDCVVSNPPYLSAGEWPGLDPEVRDHDPRAALVAGETGLEAIAVLLESAPDRLAPDGVLVLEIAPSQAAPVAELAARLGLGARVHEDLAGRARIAVVER